MTARRTGLIVTAFLLAATGLQGASQVEVDPHELYDRSREYLADGELRAAATALARLGTLIAKRPDWDPEGTFAKELLPPLQARLKRLQEIARQLDDFTVTSLQELQPPDIKEGHLDGAGLYRLGDNGHPAPARPARDRSSNAH